MLRFVRAAGVRVRSWRAVPGGLSIQESSTSLLPLLSLGRLLALFGRGVVLSSALSKEDEELSSSSASNDDRVRTSPGIVAGEGIASLGTCYLKAYADAMTALTANKRSFEAVCVVQSL